MRNSFLVCYDICDPGRLRKVHRIMKGAGVAVQYSVFRCELSSLEKQDLMSELWETINSDVDRVLFANIGPVDGLGRDCLEYWGNPCERPEFSSPIVL